MHCCCFRVNRKLSPPNRSLPLCNCFLDTPCHPLPPSPFGKKRTIFQMIISQKNPQSLEISRQHSLLAKQNPKPRNLERKIPRFSASTEIPPLELAQPHRGSSKGHMGLCPQGQTAATSVNAPPLIYWLGGGIAGGGVQAEGCCCLSQCSSTCWLLGLGTAELSWVGQVSASPRSCFTVR